MSSDHEGQPMVILEALALGRPVVTTAFASVASALPAGQGLVVERSVAGVAEGLRAYLRGAVPAPTFDAQAYNREAVAQFFRAIGLPDLAEG
jgi:glycosyltransferase involved in cell wall biosynthesis